MMMMIMTMGRDYVSELQLPTGLLFIPQVIYEHEEPRQYDIDRGKSHDSSIRVVKTILTIVI
jgi:hypothetical protein